MIHIKSPKEITAMQEGGKKLKAILDAVIAEVRPGVTPKELDRRADALIKASGGTPSFKKVPGYHWATCMCVNDIVVHGIPVDTPLQEGDIIGVDVGLFYKGLHTDASWTVLVRNQKSEIRNQTSEEKNQMMEERQHFLSVGEDALVRAIRQVRPGNRVGHISKTIQETIEHAGYQIVRELVGHGVGKDLHEDPEIPGRVTKKIGKTPLLKKGMVLAIEAIYTEGKPDVYVDDDQWTMRTEDGTIAGLFERTVTVTDHGVIILT
ncbi:MAG TPA: type I methionyl aminopeptidase [Patescibacteria group bacterium]|nr:type I methionyl aminopeptidase [Patescibacteria group bacterium]